MKPDECEELVKTVLQKGGEESENPDVRDRAYLYWRLLESDPDCAKEMVMSEKQAFEFLRTLVLAILLLALLIRMSSFKSSDHSMLLSGSASPL